MPTIRKRGDPGAEARKFLKNFLRGASAILIFWTVTLTLIFIVTWSYPPLGKMLQLALVSAGAFGFAMATYLLFFASPWASDDDKIGNSRNHP